jgi:regulator of replication initiation timing
MPRGKTVQDTDILTMALRGYEQEIEKIQQKIATIRAQLRGKASAKQAAVIEEPKPKRRLSAAARKRISAAQRKRWAEHRKKMAQASKAE